MDSRRSRKSSTRSRRTSNASISVDNAAHASSPAEQGGVSPEAHIDSSITMAMATSPRQAESSSREASLKEIIALLNDPSSNAAIGDTRTWDGTMADASAAGRGPPPPISQRQLNSPEDQLQRTALATLLKQVNTHLHEAQR